MTNNNPFVVILCFVFVYFWIIHFIFSIWRKHTHTHSEEIARLNKFRWTLIFCECNVYMTADVKMGVNAIVYWIDESRSTQCLRCDSTQLEEFQSMKSYFRRLFCTCKVWLLLMVLVIVGVVSTMMAAQSIFLFTILHTIHIISYMAVCCNFVYVSLLLVIRIEMRLKRMCDSIAKM